MAMPASLSGVQPNVKAILVIAVVVIGAIYLLYASGKTTSKGVFTQYDAASWKSSALVEIPQEVKDKAKDIKIRETTLSFTSDGKKFKINMKSADPTEGPAKLKVLLLHGMAFTSDNWQKIGTLNLIAASGWSAVAVDLPGFGKSPKVDVENRGRFLSELIHAADLGTPVVVSPSMSGSFAIPFLLEPQSASCDERLMAYVPVAPGSADLFPADAYKDCKKFEVFYREAGHEAPKSDIPLLLLHGAGSSSAVWVQINGMKLYAALGYHVVALDLPGWAKSKGSPIEDDPKKKADFLNAFLVQKRLDRPIIVAPSMSGSFTIPFMMEPRPESCESRMRGFVPIAPTHSGLYSHAAYHRCEIPVMIVYGETDKTLGLTSVGNLRNLPKSEIFMQKKAGHACIEEKPDEFHVYFYNFLRGVERDRSF